MPIYEYRCEQGHEFEVMQAMTDDPVTVCETCGAAVQRVFTPVAVHFKGSGFYNTDYGKQRRGRAKDGDGEGGGKKDGDGSKSDSSGGGDGGKDKTPAAKTSSASSD